MVNLKQYRKILSKKQITELFTKLYNYEVNTNNEVTDTCLHQGTGSFIIATTLLDTQSSKSEWIIGGGVFGIVSDNKTEYPKFQNVFNCAVVNETKNCILHIYKPLELTNFEVKNGQTFTHKNREYEIVTAMNGYVNVYSNKVKHCFVTNEKRLRKWLIKNEIVPTFPTNYTND